MCGGKGRTRAVMEVGWAASRRLSKGRFFGVTTTVAVRPRAATWAVKSRSGIMWPCAGNGNTRMCPPDSCIILHCVCVRERLRNVDKEC